MRPQGDDEPARGRLWPRHPPGRAEADRRQRTLCRAVPPAFHAAHGPHVAVARGGRLRYAPPMHGWIILDKPLGLGSTQGVSAVKRALRDGGYGKFKVGHGGTLDPLATGVLPIALGEATKLAGRMLDSDKVYDFTIGFGVQTDTLDLDGREIAASDVRPTFAAVEAVLRRFTGPIEQVPPAYSALKVDGARAYDLARAGEEVRLASRAV